MNTLKKHQLNQQLSVGRWVFNVNFLFLFFTWNLQSIWSSFWKKICKTWKPSNHQTTCVNNKRSVQLDMCGFLSVFISFSGQFQSSTDLRGESSVTDRMFSCRWLKLLRERDTDETHLKKITSPSTFRWDF